MRYILENLVSVPIPLIIVLVAGLFAWNYRRLSFFLLTFATALLVILSFPVMSVVLTYPLSMEWELESGQEVDAILVPTAGMFRDPSGRWWSNNTGVVRAVRGYQLSEELKIPLIISGGSPEREPVSEAEVLVGQLNLGRERLILEEGAANSWETALAVSRIMRKLGGDRVLLVTSPAHLKRMAATLRAQGLGVSVVASTFPNRKKAEYGWIPSAAGMGGSRGALREYIAIMYYLINRYIKLSDLV
jgi:uncharacterized SAM-binding protein YcdF (DUF218 family)